MLQVTDNGVKIDLEFKPVTNLIWFMIIGGGIVILIIAMLTMLELISDNVMITIVAILFVGMTIERFYLKKTQPIIITGGVLLLIPKRLTHHKRDNTLYYDLQPTDTIVHSLNTLKVCNQKGNILYQIQGFSDPKQIEVAQAVLEGKQIKTQGKAIKMQSN